MLRFISRLVLLVTLILTAAPLQAQTRVELVSGSKMWIDGGSTVSSFTCEAIDLEGEGYLPKNRRSGMPLQTRGTLWVPARSFDCGNRRMNSDLYEALYAESYPTVIFNVYEVVLDTTQDDAVQRGDALRMEVHGALTIAGTVRSVSFAGIAERQASDVFRFTGQVDLRMTDFGIDPPRAMMGLIRAHDAIVVRFDIRAMQVMTAD